MIDLQNMNPMSLVIILGAMSLLPLLLIVTTSLLKISMVLLITRNAIGIQQAPPTIALYAIALVATLFVMAPVGQQMREALADHPFSTTNADQLGQSLRAAAEPLQRFMAHNSDPDVVAGLIDSGRRIWPPQMADQANVDNPVIQIPAFVLSELQAGFKVGFLIYVPFIVVDLVVSNLLLALGMQMVQPTSLSLPLKMLLFILVNGWQKLLDSLFYSYA